MKSHFLFAPIERIKSPFHILSSLNRTQWLTFIAAFLGWSLDAFDFFLLSLTISDIAEEFQLKISTISSAITITLMMRPLGAIIFGLMADKIGRKIPLLINILLFSFMSFLSGLSVNFTMFFIIRAIFGIAMGGEWGLGSVLAMEALPIEARGLFSGILQQGYSFGYLLASLVYFFFYPLLGWRKLFFLGCLPALLCILIRFFVPESKVWEKQNLERTQQLNEEESKTKKWIKDVGLCFKIYWRRLIFGVLLMALFNFMSHGSQDLYPTYSKVQLKQDTKTITLTVTIMNLGAMIGGTIIGYLSQFIGRRRSIIIACILGACIVPLWWLPASNTPLLITGAFMLQFMVQGAWGVVPIYLNELSPNQIRGMYPGLVYQLGNFISSSIGQIEALLAERFRTEDGDPNYGLVMAVLLWTIFGLLIIIVLFGKEYKGKDFSENDKGEK